MPGGISSSKTMGADETSTPSLDHRSFICFSSHKHQLKYLFFLITLFIFVLLSIAIYMKHLRCLYWKLDFDNSYLASKISLQVSLILRFQLKYYLVFCSRMFPAEFLSSVNSSFLVPVTVGCFIGCTHCVLEVKCVWLFSILQALST